MLSGHSKHGRKIVGHKPGERKGHLTMNVVNSVFHWKDRKLKRSLLEPIQSLHESKSWSSLASNTNSFTASDNEKALTGTEEEDEDEKAESIESSPISTPSAFIGGIQKFVFVKNKKQKKQHLKSKKASTPKKRGKKDKGGNKENDQATQKKRLRRTRSIVDTSAIYESQWQERAIKPTHNYLYWDYHMNDESESENEEDKMVTTKSNVPEPERVVNEPAANKLSTRKFIDKHILWPWKKGRDLELTNPWLLSTMKNFHSTSMWNDKKSVVKQDQNRLSAETLVSKTTITGKRERRKSNKEKQAGSGPNSPSEMQGIFRRGKSTPKIVIEDDNKSITFLCASTIRSVAPAAQPPKVKSVEPILVGKKEPEILPQTEESVESKTRSFTLQEIAKFGVEAKTKREEIEMNELASGSPEEESYLNKDEIAVADTTLTSNSATVSLGDIAVDNTDGPEMKKDGDMTPVVSEEMLDVGAGDILVADLDIDHQSETDQEPEDEPVENMELEKTTSSDQELSTNNSAAEKEESDENDYVIMPVKFLHSAIVQDFSADNRQLSDHEQDPEVADIAERKLQSC